MTEENRTHADDQGAPSHEEESSQPVEDGRAEQPGDPNDPQATVEEDSEDSTSPTEVIVDEIVEESFPASDPPPWT